MDGACCNSSLKRHACVGRGEQQGWNHQMRYGNVGRAFLVEAIAPRENHNRTRLRLPGPKTKLSRPSQRPLLQAGYPRQMITRAHVEERG
jgi:hypothetical protein